MVKDSLKRSFCDDINLLRSVGLKPVVVHGGGPEISRTLDKLGMTGEMIEGRRVTNEADLKIVEMVLSWSINSEIVTLLNRAGGHAVGISGKDGALLRAKKQPPQAGHDMGFIGDVTSVNADFLEMLVSQNYVPVISPIGIGEDGQSYNLNADAVAAAVAVAVKASKLIYLSDVPGILEGTELLSELHSPDLEHRLASGAIRGGMHRKGTAMLSAIAGGVDRVHVIDGRTPHSVIAELFTDKGVGTLVVA